MSLIDSPPSIDQDLAAEFNRTARSRNSDTEDRNRRTHTSPRTNVTLDASLEDIALSNKIRQLFLDAKSYRKPMVSRWNKAYKMLRGRFWNTEARSSWMPTTSIPEIFPITRSVVGWMTDRRFHHIVSVASAPFTNYYDFYSQLALDLETVLDATYEVNCEEAQITTMLWDSFTYGTGILKTTWDDSLAGGMGDAKIRRVDPYGFYPDPSSHSMEDSNYFIEVKKMSLQELDRRFPGSWKKFQQGFPEEFDEAPSQLSQPTSQIPKANPAAITGQGSGTPSGQYGAPGASSLKSSKYITDPGVVVFEAWFREHETYSVDVPDPDNLTDPNATIKEDHIFDTWRVIVSAGNHILLNEKAEDIWEHGQHPYSRYVPYDLGEFWGVSLVDLLSSSQETINRLLAAALQNIELTGNPIFIEDSRAGTQRTQIMNKPGMRVTKNQGEAKWLEPPRIQADIPNFLQYILTRMQVVSGLSDAARGQTPGGRNSTSVQQDVQESAFVGVRMALRQLEYTLRDSGYKKASLIIENYTIPRMVAIAGPSGERSTLALRARHFMMPSSKGNTPMQYTLQINAGSNSDTSRKVREDKLMTLFTLGAMDVMSLLEGLNIPHREQVMQRLQQQASMGIEPPGKRERAQH